MAKRISSFLSGEIKAKVQQSLARTSFDGDYT